MDKSLIIKYEILGFFFISIVGILFHFIYNWSGDNNIVGLFGAINESVWEHLKIAVIPAFIWMLIEIIIFKKVNNIYFAKLASIILIMLTISVIFYTYKALFKIDILVLDILIFYLAIFIGQFASYKIITNTSHFEGINNISFTFLVIVFSLFMVFTYIPPKSDLFKDPIDGSYGINKLK